MAEKAEKPKGLNYSVMVFTAELGMQVVEPVRAESGDDAAVQALKQYGRADASVRGVNPYAEPVTD